MKSESKIAAFLDTHLLFAWDAETKQMIGCKWVMGTVNLLQVSDAHVLSDRVGNQ